MLKQELLCTKASTTADSSSGGCTAGTRHKTTAIPDSESSVGVGCPCGQPCAGRPGARGRISSQPLALHECLSCPRCPSDCGSPHQCSLWGDRVRGGYSQVSTACPLWPRQGDGQGTGEDTDSISSYKSLTHWVTGCVHYWKLHGEHKHT